jgi:Protein of unknown function (DUF3037)
VPARQLFDYAIVRVVPRVDRDEFVNAGVIVFCRPIDFLAARVEVDRARLLALAPDVDLDEVERQLAFIPRVCAGGQAAGALGRLSLSERFHWLTQPGSALIQTSPVHPGLGDPEAVLDHLLETVVRLPPRDTHSDEDRDRDGGPDRGRTSRGRGNT